MAMAMADIEAKEQIPRPSKGCTAHVRGLKMMTRFVLVPSPMAVFICMSTDDR